MEPSGGYQVVCSTYIWGLHLGLYCTIIGSLNTPLNGTYKVLPKYLNTYISTYNRGWNMGCSEVGSVVVSERL